MQDCSVKMQSVPPSNRQGIFPADLPPARLRELEHLAGAWGKLPKHIRAAVLALIGGTVAGASDREA